MRKSGEYLKTFPVEVMGKE